LRENPLCHHLSHKRELRESNQHGWIHATLEQTNKVETIDSLADFEYANVSTAFKPPNHITTFLFFPTYLLKQA